MKTYDELSALLNAAYTKGTKNPGVAAYHYARGIRDVIEAIQVAADGDYKDRNYMDPVVLAEVPDWIKSRFKAELEEK